jgi:hypothetical protein
MSTLFETEVLKVLSRHFRGWKEEHSRVKNLTL